jgi:hypothetical protein
MLSGLFDYKSDQNTKVPNGYFCISFQVIYNFSAFGSTYFCVSFSHERKSEMIERKFKTQNPNLNLLHPRPSDGPDI